MLYDFGNLRGKIRETEERLAKEFSGIRTGRASVSLLDGVFVSSYGSRMAVNQVASVTSEDARTLHIAPWDHSLIKEIEKSIAAADLGIAVRADASGIRVVFPELTAERREELVKKAKDRLEDARVALRAERDDVWSDIQKKERDGILSEDEKFRLKDDMEKIIKGGNDALTELFDKKESEIHS